MTEENDFIEFGKIARLSREVVITEKIDGTNAQVCISEDGTARAGSRNRWITTGDDNYGFAGWVERNKAALVDGLGAGRHFGEWWGKGIQKTYAATETEKHFSLFNTGRWNPDNAPSCCRVVPVLYRGIFSEEAIDAALNELRTNGSVASPGCMKPEGIVVYHVAANMYFKKTLEKDETPKGAQS